MALGIVDEFTKRGLKIFGPNRNASRIEADKSFAREFMYRFGIPSPKFQIYFEIEPSGSCATQEKLTINPTSPEVGFAVNESITGNIFSSIPTILTSSTYQPELTS